MPKFLAGIVVIKTFETYANSEVEAREFIRNWQEGDSEEPEPGIKVTRYKLGWEEFNTANPVAERDAVLAKVLELMAHIPGMPTIIETTEPRRIVSLDDAFAPKKAK